MAKKNYNLLIGISALVGIVLVIAFVGYLVSKPRPHVIQGEAEATEYRVSCMVPGHVTELYVREGQTVQKGDTVAFIDSPQVRAKLAQAQAARSAAQAQSAKARNGARQEQIAGAYELWQQALVQEDVMKKSFDRVQTLYDQKVISAQKYDETKAKYDAAVAQAKAAKSQYDMALSGARSEDKAAAAALVHQADGAIREVDSYLQELYLVSPADGVISNVYPRQGELVGQGSPVATVTDLSDLWFTFNIREDELHGMQTGNELTVKVPALDGATLKAKVNYMAVRESYATWKATKETDQYDAKTFEVRAVPMETVQGLRPGMTVLVVK
ncbi:MAG: efflux RND transporter periplasmic adaptor subunit [Bacteroidales bacterium]|jgi:HlyD family secretion protein|nr:efflux RND transporter periplasmic adaptor subunit [Bacteroidales bacterium]MBQ3440073.1 efflux RND transporter periplasmic adaptor subunit [Bacteroidales bacterium]MBR1794157.1 efflux RND transporter periplasmic adaptor subunit [Bacteroidales bacterium]